MKTSLQPHAALLAPAFGVYVHVPFCPQRCPYCDFNTYTGITDLAPAYLDALLREAEHVAAKHSPPPAGSYFIGGGTPTMLDENALANTIRRLIDIFGIEAGAEVTVEANPETVDARRLAVLREAGVNRVSIGAQSFSDRVLRLLGRQHDVDTTKRAVAEARAAGFDNISLDLMFGMPGETDEEWALSLEATMALAPEHISCYALTIETGTAFGADVAAGRMPDIDDDVQATRYQMAVDALGSYRHYEISNWGEPSRHNLVYWTQGAYAGLGAGAHAHLSGTRSWNRKAPRLYIENPTDAIEGSEHLDPNARVAEWLQLRLRLLDGLDLTEVERVIGTRPATAPLEAAGLLEVRGDLAVLTDRGALLENEVALRLTP